MRNRIVCVTELIISENIQYILEFVRKVTVAIKFYKIHVPRT